MPRVLIVEDDTVASDLLELTLAGLTDISVHVVGSVEEALVALASEECIDVVITDVHLPGKDGLSLVASLRMMPDRARLPVIVTTSSREPEIRRKAEDMDVLAFIEKPWSATRLRDTVHSLFHGT